MFESQAQLLWRTLNKIADGEISEWFSTRGLRGMIGVSTDKFTEVLGCLATRGDIVQNEAGKWTLTDQGRITVAIGEPPAGKSENATPASAPFPPQTVQVDPMYFAPRKRGRPVGSKNGVRSIPRHEALARLRNVVRAAYYSGVKPDALLKGVAMLENLYASNGATTGTKDDPE